jgi:hypothetical protein
MVKTKNQVSFSKSWSVILPWNGPPGKGVRMELSGGYHQPGGGGVHCALYMQGGASPTTQQPLCTALATHIQKPTHPTPMVTALVNLRELAG